MKQCLKSIVIKIHRKKLMLMASARKDSKGRNISAFFYVFLICPNLYKALFRMNTNVLSDVPPA